MSILPPVLYRAAIAEPPSLLLARPWQQYFAALDTRVGGASAPTILELAADLAALGPGLAALTLRVAALEAVVFGHRGTPTVAAVAAGAGTGAVVSVSGSDRAGVVSLTTAALADHRSNSDVLTVTFAAAWTAAPLVQVQPANDAAYGLLYGRFSAHPCSLRLVQSRVTTTGFPLAVGVTALPREGNTYVWSYSVSG